jgi:hypothetical protein
LGKELPPMKKSEPLEKLYSQVKPLPYAEDFAEV